MCKSPHNHYSSLSELLSEQSGPRLSVCIVTPDLLGPVKNGGIGTACSHLAYALAEAGHQVDVLFSQCGCTSKADEPWIAPYTARGIEVSIAQAWGDARGAISCFPNHGPLQMALMVHDWLVSKPPFDIVLFMEWQGHGFYALHAKHCGLHFQNTVMTVVTHSPSFWHIINNADVPVQPLQSCTWHMERESIRLADAVISPSAYMLNWCQAHNYTMPEKLFVQPNVLHMPLSFAPKPTGAKVVQEVVFFGRLEYRKGLEQFCNALDILKENKSLPKKITFLGKFSWMGEEHAALYIGDRSKRWKSAQLTFLPYYNQPEAVAYLTKEGRLAIMPSVADNSPCTVYECLLAGIPFLARRVGGVAELVCAEDRERCLFGDNPAELAEKIATQLGKPLQSARLFFDPDENQRAWCEGLPELVRRIRLQTRPAALTEAPFISVCLTHYQRPLLLQQAVESLLAQDYPHFEVILADDGSTDEASKLYLDTLEADFALRGWTILRLSNGYPGKARNTAVRAARGQWLVFFDDDNVALPHMLRRFAQAATRTGADFITTVFRVFDEDHLDDPTRKLFLPLGNVVAYSVIHNTLGDTTSMISRRTFEDLGGFSEDYGLGHEDFELYLRVTLAGKNIALIPEPLFCYRIARAERTIQQNTNAAANRMRSMRPFMEMLPAPLAELALMSHGMAIPQEFTAQSEECECSHLEQKKSHTRGDPSAPEAIATVADALVAGGNKKLGRQLLAQLQAHDTLSAMQSDVLRAYARQSAARGHVNKVREHMHSFMQLKAEAPERAVFYMAILDALPRRANVTALRLEVTAALREADDGSIPTAVALAAQYSYLEHVQSSIESLHQAFQRAENAYFTRRPDVQAAVQSDQFSSALHHYALYKNIDKTPWPEERLFCDFFHTHPSMAQAFILHKTTRAYSHIQEVFGL